MAANGADRQRAFAATNGGLSHLAHDLAHRFVPRNPPVPAPA
jgi:hypothetical protein